MAPIPDDPLGDQILAAAALVFAEAGVRGATLDAVAERAHVSPQTVRRRWTGKQELALAIIDRDLRIELAEVDQRMAGLATIEEGIVEGATSVYWFLPPSTTTPLTSHGSTAAYMRRCVVPLVRAAGA